MNASPFPPWSVAAPWLAGHAAGFGLVGALCVLAVLAVQGPARSRRLSAVGWGLACTLMPVAWLVARWLPEWTGEVGARATGLALAASTVVHGLAALTAVYLSDIGSMTKRPTRAPASPVPAAQEPPAPLSSAPSAPSASVSNPARKRLKPTLSPPNGATAASGSGKAPEADGLLRVLADGTHMQKAAAARALALSFGGTASSAVAHGLLSVLADEDADDESRVEAWVAVCRVMGDPLPWALESTLRNDGPSSIDPAQVLAWQDRLNEPE